ncbi:MAG: phage BR0599 family protein [Verrucomicrobia bacterium]|nr:phage BR0599 family protein [Verrucomicrobiota bacterium]
MQAPPDWSAKVRTSHALLLDRSVSLSNREGRRPYSSALRTTMSYSALLSDAALRSFVGGIRNVTVEPVLCPFWPGQRRWSERASAPIQGGLKLAWKDDWSQWELYTTVEPGWPVDADHWAPVIWGTLGERSSMAEARWINASLASLSVVLVEDGPAAYALAPTTGSVLAGPLPPAGYATAPRLLPLAPDFNGLREDITLRLEREQVGFRRRLPAEFYPQASTRVQQLDYQLASDVQASTGLAFLRDHAGRGSAFWAPAWVSAVRLTAPVGAADTVLQVSDSNAVETGDHVAMIHGTEVVGRRITAKTSSSVTLNAAVGTNLPLGTLVSPLLLVRLERPRLDLEWTHTHLAEMALAVREVAAEYSPGADETVGTTLGQLPERCFLYHFERDHGGATLDDRFTSYEANVTHGGHTWVSADLGHGSIQHGLALDSGRVDLRSLVFAGNPLVLLAALRAEVSLKLTIMSADVSGGVATNVQILAQGEVDKAALRGDRISGLMTPGGRLMSQQAPRFEVGPGCNHALFSGGCGLAKADWVHTALVNGTPSAAYPITLAVDGLARTTGPTPDYFADWFAHGWAEFGAPGTAAWQRRWILTSTAPVGGALVLTLHKAFDPLPADNAAVVLYPGCDLMPATCRAYHASTNPWGKFNNFVHFGGHPEVPPSNPSLVKLSQSVGGGKK